MFCVETRYNLNKEIDQAVDVIGNSIYKNNLEMTRINSFSIEESNIYTQNYMRNNSFVTDGSSIDAVFNAGLNGCRDITVIDSCPFVKHYYYFKLAALLGLNYVQFQRFLCNDKDTINESFLDREKFEKIKPILLSLNYESYNFWCALYDRIYNSRVLGNLFNEGNGILKIQFANNYLNNPNNYQLLREKVKFIKPKFINDNILNIEKYRNLQNIDFINICNIYDHIKNNDLELKKFVQVINSLKKRINDEGKMILYYNSCKMNSNLVNLVWLDRIISNEDVVELKDDYVVYKKTK